MRLQSSGSGSAGPVKTLGCQSLHRGLVLITNRSPDWSFLLLVHDALLSSHQSHNEGPLGGIWNRMCSLSLCVCVVCVYLLKQGLRLLLSKSSIYTQKLQNTPCFVFHRFQQEVGPIRHKSPICAKQEPFQSNKGRLSC